ncbi:hypothetical protein N825_30835 [Skermanella stibiiresistens SB22]|uniref:Uncharacterized protein n=1 Tax=Skermanella stibiiresistens SB22 TaxID=1385369 RepID=W9H4T1_9PROT|nr:class II fructose-bisphosphate aldolase [Skermanella stibiiresistens]EWY41230.1 hypothetical protein N825_30835 [Skermanella stibiiresistens SB22]
MPTDIPAPPSVLPPAIVIHGVDQLRAALTAAADLHRPLTVVSFPGAAGSAGASWFRAMAAIAAAEFPQVPVTMVLDCGDRPGHALAAIRAGVRHILLAGNVPAWPRVQAIAEASGVTLRGSLGPVFEPRFFRDPIRACRDWLTATP